MPGCPGATLPQVPLTHCWHGPPQLQHWALGVQSFPPGAGQPHRLLAPHTSPPWHPLASQQASSTSRMQRSPPQSSDSRLRPEQSQAPPMQTLLPPQPPFCWSGRGSQVPASEQPWQGPDCVAASAPHSRHPLAPSTASRAAATHPRGSPDRWRAGRYHRVVIRRARDALLRGYRLQSESDGAVRVGERSESVSRTRGAHGPDANPFHGHSGHGRSWSRVVVSGC